jgi:hypothetical protein
MTLPPSFLTEASPQLPVETRTRRNIRIQTVALSRQSQGKKGRSAPITGKAVSNPAVPLPLTAQYPVKPVRNT